MFEEVRIRECKSVKYGKTYEYRFEIAPVGGERKWLSKGGFLSEEAKEAGIEAWKRYCLCGLPERVFDILYYGVIDEAVLGATLTAEDGSCVVVTEDILSKNGDGYSLLMFKECKVKRDDTVCVTLSKDGYEDLSLELYVY